MIENYRAFTPLVPASAWVHALAYVNGDVQLGEEVSVFPSAVIRGDCAPVRIGARTNVQDGALLHTTHQSRFNGQKPLTIGSDVTIGHGAILHGCTVGDECLIGMGAIVLDGAVLEKHVLIGAGALVPPGKHLAGGYLYVGSPVRQARPLTAAELEFFTYSAANYVNIMKASRSS